jgi:DNA-binding NarL/FixJ family response regulator
MAIKVSIVEDSDRFRESLVILIDGVEGFRCVGAHPTAEEALSRIPLERPDVVLMDIHLPGLSGVDCVQELKTRLPALPIMMLTANEDSEQIFNSLMAGASGYLLKRTPPNQLLEAIQEMHRGGSPMSTQIARKVVESFRRVPPANSPVVTLTDRENEILAQLAKGFRNKEIADQLGVSMDTVRTHLRHIYEKLHVQSRTEAVLKYFQK